MTEQNPRAEIEKIDESIRQLEAAKASGAISEVVANASIEALKKERATYQAQMTGDGALAQGEGAKAVGAGGIMIEGGVSGNGVTIGNNNKVNDGKKNNGR